jgi:hypothetical protein
MNCGYYHINNLFDPKYRHNIYIETIALLKNMEDHEEEAKIILVKSNSEYGHQ